MLKKAWGAPALGGIWRLVLHILKLFAAGVFDKYLRLKIVIGHMGELLPFQIERIAKFAGRGAFGERKRERGD